MAFIPENNTGLADANSFITLAWADDYWSSRGGWEGSDAHKETALIKATDYLEAMYGRKWSGNKYLSTQALSWPRKDSANEKYDIPLQLKQACAMLAKEALHTELLTTIGRATKREKVDVIEVEYMDNAAPMPQRPAIDGLLLNTGWLNATAAWGVPFNGVVERR
jgi:hypothetical protein